MADIIRVKCPSCTSTIKASPKYQGKKVNCPKCGSVLRIPSGSASASTSSTKARTRTALPSSTMKKRKPANEVVQESILLDESEMSVSSSNRAEDDYEDYDARPQPRRSKRRTAAVEN